MGNSEDLLNKLMATFLVEAEDHIRSLSSLLIALEKEPGSAERKRLVETLYRKVHTLKGAAHTVNRPDVGDVCQSLESLLAALKRDEISLDVILFDRLHAAVDGLGRLIFPMEGTDTKEEMSRLRELIREMEPSPERHAPASRPAAKADPGPAAAAARPAPPGPDDRQKQPEKATGSPAPEREPEGLRPAAIETTPADDTVRVSARVLDALLLQTEELISAKLMVAELVDSLGRLAADLSARSGDRARAADLAQTARRRSGENGETGKLAGLVEAQSAFERELELRLMKLETSAEQGLWTFRGMVDTLLDDMKKVHLLPFSSLIDPFHKIIRDIARDLGKEAELACSGGEIEIDRRILAELREPLLHIVRNIVDHGLEKPEDRRQNGKPATGSISIGIRHQDGNRAELVIVDDGRGIDVARVKAAAVRLELLAPDQAEHISDGDALQLIFESGISTSPIITSFSGRGLGLAIVRESLERLGGHVTVASLPGRGTEFRLVLPLSIATIRGLLVEECGRACIFPAANVELTARIPADNIRTVENRETITISGQVLALVRLGDVLEISRSGERPTDHQHVVVLSASERRIAFAVDRIMEVQEVLAKPLGPQLSRVRNVAGATVLGNGRVVPILNINDLLRSAVNVSATAMAVTPRTARPDARQVSVLVAEDSITSRTLLKNILEASGFLVRTAIDGTDALNLLKTETFDIVVSDVEMPRMDGFELTAAIRRDKRFAELPVILVTGLESREDRERGIDVGASAYIVKSSFDQSRLVEVIQKLT